MVIFCERTCPESLFIAARFYFTLSVIAVAAYVSVNQNLFFRRSWEIDVEVKCIYHFFIHLNAFSKYLLAYSSLSFER